MGSLARSGYWMPLALAALVGTVAYDRGWFWVVLLCAAIGFGPWFAAARLIERIAFLEGDNTSLTEQLDATTARLGEVLDEHALCPTPLVPFDSLSKAERDHITNAASVITAASLRPSLHVVEPVTEDAPEADETWLDESPLFHDGDGQWA